MTCVIALDCSVFASRVGIGVVLFEFVFFNDVNDGNIWDFNSFGGVGGHSSELESATA